MRDRFPAGSRGPSTRSCPARTFGRTLRRSDCRRIRTRWRGSAPRRCTNWSTGALSPDSSGARLWRSPLPNPIRRRPRCWHELPERPRATLGYAVRRSHARDESLDPFVDRAERVLAEHRALGLVVELEVYPVDGEVAARGLRRADELAAKLGPRGLRRLVDRGLDLLVGGDAGRQALALQQVEDAAAALDVVVGQVKLSDLRIRQLHVVAILVALEELALDHPVDFGVDLGEVLALD